MEGIFGAGSPLEKEDGIGTQDIEGGVSCSGARAGVALHTDTRTCALLSMSPCGGSECRDRVRSFEEMGGRDCQNDRSNR